MVLRQNIAFLFIVFLTFILVDQVEADEPNIDITGIKYTNDFENGEAVTVVQSGKNESTEYSFKNEIIRTNCAVCSPEVFPSTL